MSKRAVSSALLLACLTATSCSGGAGMSVSTAPVPAASADGGGTASGGSSGSVTSDTPSGSAHATGSTSPKAIPGATRTFTYQSLDQLRKASRVIASVRATRSVAEPITGTESQGQSRTVATVRIATRIAGTSPQVITINQYPPELMPIAYGRQLLTPGQTYLVFLTPDPLDPASYVIVSDGLWRLRLGLYRNETALIDAIPEIIDATTLGRLFD